MYKKLRTPVFTTIYALLWLRFLLMIGDPMALEGGDRSVGMPFFRSWSGALSVIYGVSGVIVTTMELAWERMAAPRMPDSSGWFPRLPSVYLAQLLCSPNSERSQQWWALFQGAFTWMTLVALALVWISQLLLDALHDYRKSAAWNLLRALATSRTKKAAYEQELDERSADLIRLKAKYRGITREVGQLAEAAITDDLTQLYNKRFFVETLGAEFTRARRDHKPLSLAMMDLDHFKALNDGYGHVVGDAVLKAVAAELKKGLSKGSFACRYGGEEFALILPGHDHRRAKLQAEVLRRKVEDLRFREHPRMHTTISIGLASMDSESPESAQIKEFEDMVRLADSELYRAKLEGRNCVSYQIAGRKSLFGAAAGPGRGN